MGKESSSGKTLMVVFGVTLVLLGTLFLLNGFIPVFSISKLWPLFLLIPVVFFIPPLFDKGKQATGVLIPGTILVFLAVHFLVMNYTDWKYADMTWPNYMLAPALGLLVFWLFNREKKGVLIPVVILTGLSVIFYGTTIKNHYATAACLILLGIVILVGSVRNFRMKKPKDQ